ncbi:hypothetical protein HYH03_018171 [Edaphochlamys debaryana]|uniref:PLA2c domain-containing protein n=1 Tax=Edaphochlamys debaryana TaxID=47281 RepID=A0A835XIJ0_9CHLO|nr:hypothetical protein HYH03_018171 [Edaphochlamys debaryana]|eukprot:KAG2482946.1 hypothetical protein HYH03_018171 [Edaphochlamys debaryana]
MGCGASREQKDVAKMAIGAGAAVVKDVTAASGAVGKALDAVVAGTVLRPALDVKVWVGSSADGSLPFPELSDPDFALPALGARADLAVCLSGGGFRATSLGLGWLRALHQLGVLGRAKYLCACSGSSWLSAPLVFQTQVDTGTFLGPCLPPEACSLEALKQVGDKRSSYAAAASDATPLLEYLGGHARDLREYDLASLDALALLEADGVQKLLGSLGREWSDAMAWSFLAPFGLGEVDGSTTGAAGTQGGVETRLAARGAAVGRGTAYLARPEMPYLVVSQVVMLPKDPQRYYPLEWTPMYSGVPVHFPGTSPPLGGGWVEALGGNGELMDKPSPNPAPGSSATVSVRPLGPASLGEAIGISSSANAVQWALGRTLPGKMAHDLLGFNVAQCTDMRGWSSSSLQLADGGGVDYLCIYPPLRRGVGHLVVCCASLSDVSQGLDEWNRCVEGIATAFGCWLGDPDKSLSKLPGLSPQGRNQTRQVFASERFAELYEALLAKYQAGEPPVHVGEYEVLPNASMGVAGGYVAKIMWVVNQVQSGWEAALPEDTRERLRADRATAGEVAEGAGLLLGDTLKDFPHVPTTYMNYSPAMVSLMAHHASHMLLSHGGELRGMAGL